MDGKSALTYLRTPTGSQSLQLRDQDGNARLKITLANDGTPSIVVVDENGRRVFITPKE